MSSYAPVTPRDRQSEPKQGYPPATIALATSNKENASASSILLLNDNCSEIEVAVTGNTAGKWLSQTVINSSVAGTSVITGAALTPNFDFMIGANTVRRFVVPIVTQVTNMSSVSGVQGQYGLAAGVAFKTFVGNTSVLTVQR